MDVITPLHIFVAALNVCFNRLTLLTAAISLPSKQDKSFFESNKDKTILFEIFYFCLSVGLLNFFSFSIQPAFIFFDHFRPILKFVQVRV